MAKHCRDEECPLPHYRIGKYRYCATSSATSKKKPKPIKPISDKQSSLLREYRIVRDAYMKEHPVCEICGNQSTDLHHKRSRGKYLSVVEYFMAVCRTCHHWIHENHTEAVNKGYIISKL